MPITTCTACGASINAPDGTEGKKVRCGKCQAVVVVVTSSAIQAKPVEPKPLPVASTPRPKNLVECPDCGHMVSRRAASCPKCGYVPQSIRAMASSPEPPEGAKPTVIEQTSKELKAHMFCGFMVGTIGTMIACSGYSWGGAIIAIGFAWLVSARVVAWWHHG